MTQDLLTLYFNNTNKKYYLRELERILGYSAGNIRRELQKLSEDNFFLKEKIGNLIFYKLNGNHPLYAEIKNIINKTAGITEKIKTSLFKVTYIETAEKDLNTAKRNIDIDEECAFTYAYNSMLHCGLALMNSQGYRPKHAEKHKNIVRFCDSFLGNDFSDLIIIYNYMRKSRHKFLYEPDVPCTKNVPG